MKSILVPLILLCQSYLVGQTFFEHLPENMHEVAVTISGSICNEKGCTALIEIPYWIEQDDTASGLLVGNFTVDKDNNKILGQANIFSHHEDTLLVFMPATNQMPASLDGHLVVFKSKVSNDIWRNDLFPFICLSINLQDVYGDPLLFNDSWSISMMEDYETMQNMLIGDIRFTGSAMREQMEDREVTEGFFKGKTLFDVMEQVSKPELQSFLRYVGARPLKYMGNTWKISEIFATWVDHGSPHTLDDLFEKLARDSEYNHSTFIEKYGHLLNEDDLDFFRGKASMLFADDKKTEARLVLDFILAFAGQNNFTEEVGWTYFKQAEFFEKEEEFKAAIESYQSAQKSFQTSKSELSVAVVDLNMANCYNNIGKPAKAINILKSCIPELKRIAGVDHYATLAQFIGLGHSHLGYAYYLKKDYSLALSHLQDAQKLYEQSQPSMEKFRTLYARLAVTYLELENDEMYNHYVQLMKSLEGEQN